MEQQYDPLSLTIPPALKKEIRELSIERCESMTETCRILLPLGLTAYYAQQEDKDDDA